MKGRSCHGSFRHGSRLETVKDRVRILEQECPGADCQMKCRNSQENLFLTYKFRFPAVWKYRTESLTCSKELYCPSEGFLHSNAISSQYSVTAEIGCVFDQARPSS